MNFQKHILDLELFFYFYVVEIIYKTKQRDSKIKQNFFQSSVQDNTSGD